jgi:hypothetical protein
LRLKNKINEKDILVKQNFKAIIGSSGEAFIKLDEKDGVSFNHAEIVYDEI